MEDGEDDVVEAICWVEGEWVGEDGVNGELMGEIAVRVGGVRMFSVSLEWIDGIDWGGIVDVVCWGRGWGKHPKISLSGLTVRGDAMRWFFWKREILLMKNDVWKYYFSRIEW